MIRFPHVTGVVLAGGRALRLGGRDKGDVSLGPDPVETPMNRILDAFEGRFSSTIVVISPERDKKGNSVRGGVVVVKDIYPLCGPLGGLHAALANTATTLAFVCGCDMPFLSVPFIDHLIGLANVERALVPLRAGRPEPLLAVYPASLVTAVEEALEEGVRKMTDFFDRVDVDYLPEADYRHLPDAVDSFENINTPDDLRRAGEKLERKNS